MGSEQIFPPFSLLVFFIYFFLYCSFVIMLFFVRFSNTQPRSAVVDFFVCAPLPLRRTILSRNERKTRISLQLTRLPVSQDVRNHLFTYAKGSCKNDKVSLNYRSLSTEGGKSDVMDGWRGGRGGMEVTTHACTHVTILCRRHCHCLPVHGKYFRRLTGSWALAAGTGSV